MEQVKTMLKSKDRYVTDFFMFPSSAKSMGIMVPTLDTDSNITVEVSCLPHTYSYPFCISYATDNITMELQCDDADGSVLVDSVENVKMTEQGDPTYATSAATVGLGKMVEYDGTGDMHDCIDDDLNSNLRNTFKTGDFSVEMVVKLTDTTNSGTVLFEKMNTTTSGVGFTIGVDATGEQLSASIYNSSNVGYDLTPETDISDGTIKHIVVTFDRDGNMTPYINSTAGTAVDISGISTDSIANTKRLALFGDSERTNLTTGSCYFVRVYSRVLSANEITDNYFILMNKGYPGWLPVQDYADGQAFLCNASTHDPAYIDLTQFIGSMKNHAVRIHSTTAQAATTDLDFVWVWS